MDARKRSTPSKPSPIVPLPKSLEDNTAMRLWNPLPILLIEFLRLHGALWRGAPVRLLQPHGPLMANCPPSTWRKTAGAACIGSARILANAGCCTASSHCPFWRATTMTCS